MIKRKGKKITGVVKKANEIDGNGIMYSEECLKNIMMRFNERNNNLIGISNVNKDGDHEFKPIVRLSDASHKIDSFNADNKDLVVEATIIETTSGAIISKYLEEGKNKDFSLGIRGYYNSEDIVVNEEGVEVINYFKINSVNIIKKDESA